MIHLKGEHGRHVHYVLLRVLDNGFVRQSVVFSADLLKTADARPPDPRIRWTTEADKEALVRFGLRSQSVEACFKGGGRIAVLEDNGRLVARNCYWTHALSGGGGVMYDFPADAVMASDGFVSPGFRGQRYLAGIKAFAAQQFLADGYRRMLSVSRWRNAASIKAHGQVHALPLFRIVMVRGPFGIRAIWANDGISFARWSKGVPPKLIHIP